MGSICTAGPEKHELTINGDGKSGIIKAMPTPNYITPKDEMEFEKISLNPNIPEINVS